MSLEQWTPHRCRRGVCSAWPTPTARDHRGGQAYRVGDPRRHGGWNLNDWAAANPGTGHLRGQIGHLNPPWVEWLMGFPAGWTELETP